MCKITLLELAWWLKVNRLEFFGIDEDFTDIDAVPNDECGCDCNHYVEEFLEGIDCANQFFDGLAEWTACPTQFEETIPFPYPYTGYLDRYFTGKTLTTSEYPIQELGEISLTLIGDNIPLTRVDGLGELLEQFSFTIAVPDDTCPEDIRVFFTPEDGGYDNLGDACSEGCDDYEIRPLNIVIDESGGEGNWTATITGFEVVFIKPNIRYTSPYDENPCLPYLPEIFVEEVNVYVEDINVLEAVCIRLAKFRGCGCADEDEENCEDKTCCVCGNIYNCRFIKLTYKTPVLNDEGDLIYEDISNCTCDDCLYGIPQDIRVKYIAGDAWKKCNIWGLQHHRILPSDTQRILALLAINCADCIERWSDCDDCNRKTINKLKRVQYVFRELDDPNIRTEVIDWLSVNPYNLNLLPTEALVKATTMIRLKNQEPRC